MEKHWSNYCTMSIVYFVAFPETNGSQGAIVEGVRKIAEDDFFDAIEIDWIEDATPISIRDEGCQVFAF
jgi:hypothetical protein